MRPTFAIPLLAAALLAAGCVDAPELEAAATEADTAAPAAPAPVPFAFDGRFGPGAYACPLVTCAGADPGSARWTPLDHEGTLTDVALTLTWDAAAPHMETLRLGLSWDDGNEFEYVEGASPLAFELQDVGIDEDEEPYLWVWIASPARGIVTLASPQEFAVEGTLVTVADAPSEVDA